MTAFGRKTQLDGRFGRILADLDVGPLFVFAIASLSVYGITLAGWSSNNKYALMGSVRSSAQMISYELALGLSIVGVRPRISSIRIGLAVARGDIPAIQPRVKLTPTTCLMISR
mgnify:CR=1 FL=1